MKKETWITVFICVVFLGVSGWLYLRSGNGTDDRGQQWQPVAESSVPSGDMAEEDLRTEECTVYICGAVRRPGVYRFDSGARVCDAVEAAGGFTKKAVWDAVNQARMLTDGEQITIPVKSKAKKNSPSLGKRSELVNINQANLSELMTLSGIGEAKAKLIVEYRDENGSFSATEDIMKISGIKEGIYNRIKDRITV